MSTPLRRDQLAALCALGTCTVSNAIETFSLRLRNEGFMDSSVRCLSPQLGATAGHAVTVTMRCSSPPPKAHAYLDRTDWWNYLLTVPAPRLVILQDVDPQPGLGSFIGEIHASILRALDCVGAVTNGSVRDLPALEGANFPTFARGLSVTHAYSHLVGFGEPVTVGGLKVRSGDLLLGDVHGVVSVPGEILAEIPAVAAGILERERELMQFCRSRDFSLERLRDRVRNSWPPQ